MNCTTCEQYDIGSITGTSLSEFRKNFYVITEESDGIGYAKGNCYCNECKTTYLWDYENNIHDKLQLQFLPKKAT